MFVHYHSTARMNAQLLNKFQIQFTRSVMQITNDSFVCLFQAIECSEEQWKQIWRPRDKFSGQCCFVSARSWLFAISVYGKESTHLAR